MDDELTRAEVEQRRRAATTHGGAGAYKAIQDGKAFKGLAAQEERNVQADLEELGQREMLKELAVRLHTCTRLYYAALQTAVDNADLEGLDRYAKRFGWLAGKTSKAWKELGDMPDPHLEALDYEQILKQRGRDDGETD
jgi:hypothetical protein